MDSRLYDVIVVGAGPAGSRVARDMAQAGFDVGILEEHPEVGRPVHCSGLVSPRTLEVAEVEHDVVLNTLRGALVHAAGRTPIKVGGDRIYAYVIDRVELDRRLAAQAVAAGADLVQPARFERYRLAGQLGTGAGSGWVAVTAVRDRVETELRARLLIGADGARSKVARQIRGADATGMVAGLSAHADYAANPYGDHVEVFLDHHAAPGWFGWSIPLGDGTARIGTGSANGIKPVESFERLRQSFPSTYGTARIHSRSAGTIALWEPTSMVADRVMLIGDAARQVKPTSGGGIHTALEAAAMAARHAQAALNGPGLSSKVLGSYRTEWRRTMGRELRRQYDLRRMLTRLGPVRLDVLMNLLERETLRAELESRADIDFPSYGLRRLALRHPLAAVRLGTWPRFPAAWIG